MLATIYSDIHLRHDPTTAMYEGHPFVSDEVPARAEVIVEALRQADLGPIHPPDDFGPEPILAVHTADYVEYLRGAYAENTAYFQRPEPVFGGSFFPRGGLRKPNGVLGLSGYYAFGSGTPITEGTWEAAHAAAQCALTAAARVKAGERAVYALCRPPGHHAAADLLGGFCYLNNAAIAARWLGGRVAVLDLDYHHGNGTQMIFYNDPSVLFCSLHAHPDDDYPHFWGAPDELGEGDGLGFNRNWTLPQNCDDQTYLAALDDALEVVAGYVPEYVVVSAGWDTAAGDPVGGFRLSTDGLAEIGRRVAELGKPTVIVQEGGYLLERLGQNALAFLRAFA